MYYSAIGILALLVLLIENQDIILNFNRAFEVRSWVVYRRFLISVVVYYITDILWGFIEAIKLDRILFADTTVYFMAMAAGMVFWSLFVVCYLEADNRFGRIIISAGHTVAFLIVLMSLINIFVPVLFTVDGNCVYRALPVRYVVLACQILMLLIISVYAFRSIITNKNEGMKLLRYRTVALFGVIMATFLFIQIWFPYLPLYSIAYLLGISLLRAFVIGDEKEEYRNGLMEAEKIVELKHSISALLDNMPALTFSKDAETGVYLACNQAFAEYAHKDSPDGVIGLTDAEIFDAETARHFAEDDKMALSMETPYIFFEDVRDATGNQKQFQTTKLKFVDQAGRLCTLGMCEDVTDMVRIKRENATTREAYENARSTGIIFSHIAQALAHGYEDLYYVNTETEEYIEYHIDDSSTLNEARRGDDFFTSAIRESEAFVYPEDREAVLNALEKDTLLDALDRNKTFQITYRLNENAGPEYARMKVSRMEDDERYIILGISNVDEEMKQQRSAERVKEEHIAYGRINALVGDFLCVYVIDPETERYREFSASDEFGEFGVPKEGDDFFNVSRERGKNVIHPEDLNRYLTMFNKETVISEIEKCGIFSLTYRLIMNGRPNYIQLKAAMVNEQGGRRLVVGITDIEDLVRQEEEYANRLAMAQSMANVDALTGVKNKHAYLDEEEKLDRMIDESRLTQFSIVILDVNDLKKVNDAEGHQAGDQYLRSACKIICDIFKKSPVFRVGGDEFAVVVQGDDYANIEELLKRMDDHNTDALRNGGIVIACGMARFEDDKCTANVFERADTLMYKNKSLLKERA